MGLKGPMEQRKGSVQKYTVSVQQNLPSIKGQGRVEWREVGARAKTILARTKPIKYT